MFFNQRPKHILFVMLVFFFVLDICSTLFSEQVLVLAIYITVVTAGKKKTIPQNNLP